MSHQTEEVPQEVRELVGTAMSHGALSLWWTTPLRWFGNQRPLDVWIEDRSKVLEFIQDSFSDDAA